MKIAIVAERFLLLRVNGPMIRNASAGKRGIR